MIMYNSETNRLEEVKSEWKTIASEEFVRDISKLVLRIMVPDNPTNGDVIKALFPTGEKIGETYTLSSDPNDSSYLECSDEWWNTAFNKESINE